MDIIELKEKPAATPLSADDLLLLVDLFYLPYNHGQKAKQIITDFKWLKFNAIKEDSQEFMELTEQEQKTKVKKLYMHWELYISWTFSRAFLGRDSFFWSLQKFQFKTEQIGSVWRSVSDKIGCFWR